MPPRQVPLITGQIYHLYNSTIDNKRIFLDNKLCNLLLELLYYYRSTRASISYSRFRSLTKDRQMEIVAKLKFKKYFKLDLFAYCVMSTHIHLLVKQQRDGAISKYMSDTFNSFTRFYNIKHRRKGPLMLPRFHAKLIVSREQFIHVSRYLHLNPYSAGLLELDADILTYPWSSMREYLTKCQKTLSQPKAVLAEFNNKRDRYKKFVLDHAEQQKTLELVKHAEKW